MVDRRPALIARCRTTADVQDAVGYAREAGLAAAVYCGGHAATGHAVCDDGLVIDLRELNHVEVDPVARTARVGGGTNWGIIDAATQEHALAVTGGRVPGTGVAGRNARPSPLSAAIVIRGGGAIARVDDDAMAFGQRSAPFNIHLLHMWAGPAENEAQIAWIKEFGAAMKPYAFGGAYLNFIGDEGAGRVREAFGEEKFARLQGIKAVYDPQNLFRLNQNIPPA